MSKKVAKVVFDVLSWFCQIIWPISHTQITVELEQYDLTKFDDVKSFITWYICQPHKNKCHNRILRKMSVLEILGFVMITLLYASPANPRSISEILCILAPSNPRPGTRKNPVRYIYVNSQLVSSHFCPKSMQKVRFVWSTGSDTYLFNQSW